VDLCYGGAGHGFFIKVSKQLLRGLVELALEYASNGRIRNLWSIIEEAGELLLKWCGHERGIRAYCLTFKE
jgi:hypothetical protein